MVSLTTFQRLPPGARKLVPLLPSVVIHPSMLSVTVLARTRITSTESSFVGPSRISTTSPISRRRIDLESLMLISLVMAVSFVTFMYTRMKFSSFSLESEPADSSSRWAKTLLRSSSESSATSASPSFLGSFSQFCTNLTNSPNAILSFLLIAASTSSFERVFAFWWYLIVARALFSNAPTSAVSLLLPSAWSLPTVLVALVRRGSILPSFASSFLTLIPSQTARSASTPSDRASTVSFDAVTETLAFSTAASMPLTCAMIADDVFTPTSGTASFSAATTSSSVSPTVFSAASILTCSASFSSSSRFSFARRSCLRTASLACSRAMPT
mmetsp:Transcript_26421/g.78747  ORF Transcript_26421/g.78747 Transcript_26421/m.78747 type:complete len:328 (+) Transcript_26421:359-1342(+)